MPPALRTLLLGAPLLTAGGGLALQFYVTIGAFQARGESALAAIWLVLLFFTILTNMLVVVASVAALRDPQGRGFWSRPSTQAAIALHIAIVGVVFAAVLRGLVPLEGPAVAADFLLHTATPLLFTLYWLLAVPKGTLTWRSPLPWLVYPLAYLAYALVRGALGGVYPYPFIDLAKLGAAQVALNALGMLALYLALGFGMAALDRALGARG